MNHRRSPLLDSFAHAFRGFALVLRSERNIRIHSVLAFFAVLLGVLLRFTPWELSIVLLVSAAVIASELFNAALERICDMIKPRVSGYVAHAKDIAAAAVLVLSLASFGVGILLYAPKIFRILFTGN